MNTLSYAIQMENDGEKYYLMQAEKNQKNSMNLVFLVLANAENKHAELLKNKVAGMEFSSLDNQFIKKGKSIFSELGDFERDAFKIPGQLEVYRLALEMEQKSIDIYQQMLTAAQGEDDKKILKFLLGQEKDHFALFEDLVMLLKNPEEWVESAEFGLREEY